MRQRQIRIQRRSHRLDTYNGRRSAANFLTEPASHVDTQSGDGSEDSRQGESSRKPDDAAGP
jgi:hypothetical protein